MDWKIKIKISTFIISFILMLIILYICVNKYFEYKTTTAVKKLDSSRMPEVEWFLCGELEALYNGSKLDKSKIKHGMCNTWDYEQVIIGLYMNGTGINDHGEPFKRENDKCWQMFNIPPFGELSFTIQTRKGTDEDSFYLTRDIKGKLSSDRLS